ncbi:MAG: Methyltransferase type [Geobacteraceae bacterium]|nr:MAG: Methyltransferase type [Geobacteraceae bacterium]
MQFIIHQLNKNLRAVFRHLKKSPSNTMRNALKLHLSGDGIEIGALHEPLDISGLPISSIRYVDRMSSTDLRERYPELKYRFLVSPDVIDDGEKLTTFHDASLDFIIANHMIEHSRNPIGTIRTWLTKLRPCGIIFMAIPDMRVTFDKDRPITTVEHLCNDDELSIEQLLTNDYEHYREYTELVIKEASPLQIDNHAKQLMESNYSIHYHTFTSSNFLQMLNYAQKKLPFAIRAFTDNVKGSNEFIFVLGKNHK